jgi:hypothetical protein
MAEVADIVLEWHPLPEQVDADAGASGEAIVTAAGASQTIDVSAGVSSASED